MYEYILGSIEISMSVFMSGKTNANNLICIPPTTTTLPTKCDFLYIKRRMR